MARGSRGYKLVDDPLEGILGNVLKLQQLQEGYEQGEQRKQDRYFNKLSSFQQNLTANLTDRNAMEMNLKMSQSFYDKNKGDMDSNMIGAFQDYTKMVNDKISAHADANIAYQQYNSFQDGMFGLTDHDKDPETPEVAGGFFNKIENVDDEQTWSTPDETGKTLAEQAGEKLATFADLERRVAEGLEYLTPSQQRYFQTETEYMQNVNNAIIYELSDKGMLNAQDIDLLNTNPQEFLNLNQTKIDIRRKDQVEFNNQINSIQYAQSEFKAAEESKGIWVIGTGAAAEEFDLSDKTRDDKGEYPPTGYYAARVKYAALENQKKVLTNAFNTKYAYTPLIGEPVKPVADRKDVDPEVVDPKDVDPEVVDPAKPEVVGSGTPLVLPEEPLTFEEWNKENPDKEGLAKLANQARNISISEAIENKEKYDQSRVELYNEYKKGVGGANLTKEQKVDASLSEKERAEVIKKSSRNKKRRTYILKNLPVGIQKPKRGKVAYSLNKAYLELTSIMMDKGINPQYASPKLVLDTFNQILEKDSALAKEIKEFTPDILNLYKKYTNTFKGKITS